MEEVNGVLNSLDGEAAGEGSVTKDKQDAVAWPERDRVIFELLYGCGIRNSELVGLDMGSVKWRGGAVVGRGKGGEGRLVPLGGEGAVGVEGLLPLWEGRVLCAGE